MSNNDNILQNYFAALNEHFDEVSNFNNQTTKLLTSDKMVDLFCKDLGAQALSGTFVKNKPTNIEKLLVTIKEIGTDSKSYQDKLSIYVLILEQLINFVVQAAE